MKVNPQYLLVLKSVALFFISAIESVLIVGLLSHYWVATLQDWSFLSFSAYAVAAFSSIPLFVEWHNAFALAIIIDICVTTLIYVPMAMGASC